MTGNAGTSYGHKSVFNIKSFKSFSKCTKGKFTFSHQVATYIGFMKSEVPRGKSSGQNTLAESDYEVHHPKPAEEMIDSHTV